MTEIKYSYNELSEISKTIFEKLIEDEIFDAALVSSSFFDYVDLKIKGYAVLASIKSRACTYGNNESKKYSHIVDEKRLNFCDMDLEEMELKRFVHIKNRRREKRGVKTMFNIHPVKFCGEAKKEIVVSWEK